MSPYETEDLRLKLLWTNGSWKSQGRCSGADAARLRFVDEYSAALLISAWIDGRLTWRQLWRIASDYAGDFQAQEKKLKCTT